MSNSEVLMAIDNITYEQRQIVDNVNMAMLEYYQKQHSLLDYYDEISDDFDGVFLEAATKNKEQGKVGILQTIWNAIKQFFKMLSQQFNRLINKIKGNGKDGSNGEFVSCDSIVLRVLSRSAYNNPDDTSTWKIPQVNPIHIKGNNANEVTKDNIVTESPDPMYITFNVPAGKGSTFYPKTVKVPSSDIIAELNNDDKTISFHITGFSKWNKTRSKDSGSSQNGTVDVKDTKKAWTHSSKISLYLISDPDMFDKFIAITDLAVEILFDKKKHHINIFNKKCKKIIDDMNNKSKRKKLDKVKVSLKDLSEFQKKVNTLNYKLDKFSNISTDVSEFDKETINNFNLISKKLLDIQVSMNLLSSSLNNSLIVNKCFVGCIKNIALLDQFVATMIDEGIPPKYVAYNTWLVADNCIKGQGEKYKPIWGQTRFIFFPPDKRFVYKIAMSGMGITSNRAEARTSDMFEKMDRVDLIAPVVKTWERETIVAMERIDNSATPSYPEIIAYTKNVNDAIVKYEKDHKVHLNIAISDQHKDNVKYDKVNKCFRSIDYGIANRSYIKHK